MSEPQQPEANASQGDLPQGFQIGSILATPIPAERTFPLRLDQFQILCLGIETEARSGMYFCMGLLVSALIGLFTLFENADWTSFWVNKSRALLGYFAFLLVIIAGSITGIVICWRLRKRADPVYSALKQKIQSHFSTQP